jgi:hypothetical protein
MGRLRDPDEFTATEQDLTPRSTKIAVLFVIVLLIAIRYALR